MNDGRDANLAVKGDQTYGDVRLAADEFEVLIREVEA
jgi:hypothetical protein